jgi:gliding motility-associated-like protein
MKKFILLALLFFSLVGYSQITIDETLTTQQLIEDILINSSCAEVSNFIQSTGTDFGDDNGIAAFDANGSNFPYQSGIVLSSGNVANAAGPNLTLHSDGGFGWPGDADLEANTTATNTNNASFIQFDFVPQIDEVNFNFLLASEEYNQNFECTYSDAFAFILTDQVTGVVQNLAVLPGTAIPIEVTNIHPDVPGGCPAINEIYFDKYNFDPFNPAATAAIDFNGQIKSLTAVGNVIPGNLYSIKLVIADETDTALDSAVFLEAGSFNIGVDLGDDLTIAAGNAPCQGVPLEIGVAPDITGASTYQWFLYNPITMVYDLIPGETSNTIIITQSGTYQIQVTTGGGCDAVDDVVIEFAPQPIAVVPDDLDVCDDLPNDGFAEFDLTVRDAQIQNSQPNTFVEYYLTLAAAEAGSFPITPANAFTNTQLGFQVIYARLEEITFGCYDIVPLNLQVNDSPAITDPITDYFLCDNDQDGVEVFDLTSKDSEILNTLVNVTLTYHTSMADAQSGAAPITPADSYSSGNTVIWVRAINSADCVTVGSFNLVLGSVPNYTIVPEFSKCDDAVLDGFTSFDLNEQNFTITNGNIGLNVTYYGTQADAEAGVMPLPIPYTNTINPETIWVRVESNATGCYGVFPMDLVVVAPPEIFQPDPLTYCDLDNDGFGTFTLTDADEQVVNGNPAGNLQVSYHYTMADAQNGVLPLTSPYDNVVIYNQTVYVRLVDIATGCYSTTTLQLIVLDSPQISDPSPLVVCDDDGDGFAIFDLTDSEAELLAGLTPADYTVTYYDDAGLTNAIGTPTSYPNTSNPQTIYIVVEDIANGCKSESTVALQVSLPPVLVNPTPLELCDENDIVGPNDEIELFNLNSKKPEITGGDLSISIKFFETLANAQANTNAITNPGAYQNLTNPQTIYIRAEDVNSNCVVDDGMITLDLIVNPLPSPTPPTPLEVCDVDNDGFAFFTLTDKDAEIIGGEDITVTYHETLLDANNGTFALNSPYQNIVANMQTIYVRAEISLPPPNDSDCYKVIELVLLATPTPVVPLNLAPLVICDDDGDGFAEFNLTDRADDIYGSQLPSEYTLTYHTTLAGAQNGTAPIAAPEAYTNTVNPQTIFVRLEDNTTECFKVGQFELQVSIGPSVTQPTALVLCDDVGVPNDGFTVFNLTDKNDEITGGAPGVGVKYYETLQDAQDDTNAIDPDTAYTNLTNPQVLYVRVTDGNTECFDATVTLTLRVRPNPTPEIPDPIELCDYDTPGDGVEEFDLTIREAQILDGETWDVLYYENQLDALGGDATLAIPDPTAYTNTGSPQIIYVRVTNNTEPEACFELVELVIIVNALPDDTTVLSDYIICEVPFDGVAFFNLETKIDEILNGQDPAIHEITFYENDVDAAGMINKILNPTAYQNDGSAPPGQPIYVGILNTETGCYIGGVQFFNLIVQEGAVANTPAAPYTICDNLDENDGIGQFTLISDPAAPTDLDGAADALAAEILGAQDPTVFLITYHETLANAETNTDALSNVYVNGINPQVIYARVTNSANTELPQCYDVTEVILKVEELPNIVLDETYRLCIDENGNPIPEEEGAMSPPVIDTGLSPTLYTFMWELDGVTLPGEFGPSIVALQGGVYTVTVTEISTGCSNTAETTVTVSQPPVTYDAVVVNGAFADNHTIQVTAEGLGTYVFQLDDGPFQDNPTFENVLPGEHTITIKDENGCGSVTIEVNIIDYPQVLTPNNDGYHDTWNIIGIAKGDPTAKIYIFDRYGKLLKQVSPLGAGWDGTFNGNPMPSSDYWFRVEYKEQDVTKEFKGHFTLKR